MLTIKNLALYAGAVTLGLSAQVQAQDPAAKKYASSAVEEVVVTARKSTENLQVVPLSIKPIGAEAIEAKAVQNLEDIANLTPGLNYSGGFSSGAQSSVTIRGLSQGFVQDRTQNVAVFLDGIYLQRQSMANVGLLDMERIEVVKGPQSALYGRNAFSGAINYITKKPTDNAEGYISTTQGSDGREDYTIRAAGPIVEEKLLGSWTYGTQLYDGHTENDHPFAKANPAGFSDGGSDAMLGGWDNDTYNIALIFRPNDDLELNAGFNHSDMNYETQPSYILSGAREVAKFGTTPYNDMNFNPVRQTTVQADNTADFDYVYGNTMWYGRLPTSVPKGVGNGWTDYVFNGACGTTNSPADVECNYPANGPKTGDFGFGGGVIPVDPRLGGTLSDPRNVGSIAGTDIINLGANWTINDSWTAKYLYGHIDHNGYTGGVAERDPLYGNFAFNVSPAGYLQSNTFSARPVVDTKAVSHEARFEWAGNDLIKGAFGFYYGHTEDSQYDQTTYAGMCTTEDRFIDDFSGFDANSSCYEAVDPNGVSPYSSAVFPGITKFFGDYWSGGEGNSSEFDDHIRSVFATMDYQLTSELKLRLEGRFTQEDRRIERLSDQFALGAGQIVTVVTPTKPDTVIASGLCAPGTTETNYTAFVGGANTPDPRTVECIPEMDSDRSEYFSPRIGLDWSVTDDNFLYTYLAEGVKAGGFNNTSSPDQQRYEEESNWTFEIGSKNTLLDGALTLNGAVYYVDWSDVQASEAPKSVNAGPNANAVIGNTSGITNLGFEVDGVWNLTDSFYVDLGYAHADPKYDDDATFDAAKRYYFYQCGQPGFGEEREDGSLGTFQDGLMDISDGEVLCGNDDIGGNMLPRASEDQINGGVNYVAEVADGWTMTSRLDANYQSKQYVDQLNLAYIPSRTLYNASIKMQAPENWEVIFWGKNITGKEYISSAFVLALFNKNIVSYGAGESYGVTAKYNF